MARSVMPTATARSQDARNAALEIYKAQLKAMGKKKGGSGAAIRSAQPSSTMTSAVHCTLLQAPGASEGFFTNLFMDAYDRATGFGAYRGGTAKHRRCVSMMLRTIQASPSTNCRQCEQSQMDWLAH